MSSPEEIRNAEEIWESTIPGRIWVTTVNARGTRKDISVGGREGARLRIAKIDREITQEQIVDPLNDPFLNGMLRRVDADQNKVPETKTDQALSTEDLVTLFAKDTPAFQSAVDALSEVNVRRMLSIAKDVDATMSQQQYLKDSVQRRWPITSGDTETYRELKAASQVAGSR